MMNTTPDHADAVEPTPETGELSGALPQLSRAAWAWTVAGLLALVGVVATYAIIATQAQTVRWREVGFHVVDDSQIVATFEVYLYTDEDAECLVRALNESYTEVGVVTVPVARADGSDQQLEALINTTERATTATVVGCDAASS